MGGIYGPPHILSFGTWQAIIVLLDTSGSMEFSGFEPESDGDLDPADHLVQEDSCGAPGHQIPLLAVSHGILELFSSRFEGPVSSVSRRMRWILMNLGGPLAAGRRRAGRGHFAIQAVC